MTAPTVRGLGIDLVDVGDVTESVNAHGERYLERIFDAVERRECGLDAGRLAMRFAVKEATIKALMASDGLPWRSISVQVDSIRGAATVTLNGEAAATATRRKIAHLSASVVRRRSSVAALVLAEG